MDNILSFFPNLGKEEKNPRVQLMFIDDSSKEWFFMFIYYNNKFFNGTRNEYRLTGMTKFINQYSLKAGDEVVLINNEDGNRYIKIKRAEINNVKERGVLKLGKSWKVVKI